MERKKLKAAKKKDAWTATKTAVRAYAKNPCKATEIEVAAAFNKVRTLSAARGFEEDRTGPARRAAKKPTSSRTSAIRSGRGPFSD